MIYWLQGPSGSGKTTIGRALAALIGVPFLDTDQLIEQEHGPIPALFAARGEKEFRRLEREVVERIVAQSSRRSISVVAVGGGAVVDPLVRDLMRTGGPRVLLEVSEETALKRLEGGADRPLLAGDPAARWRELLAARRAAYADTDLAISAEGTPEEIAATIFEEIAGGPGASWSVMAELAGEHSEIASYRSAAALLDRVIALTSGRRVCLVTDGILAGLYPATIAAMAGDGVVHAVEPGEGSKNLSEVERIAARMVEAGFSRRDVVIGFGGGVVTDLAGFAASVFMRGIRAIYVPTTLLAQVDASVGGKTAVDAAGVRNLIGTFRQPTHVLLTGSFLATLPARELRSGFVEALKMGIANSDALDREVARAAPAVIDGALPRNLAELIRRSVEAKLDVVVGDVRDEGGRMSLNFGHTFGHALEAALPGALAHGEAVAVGIVAASEMALALGLINRERAEEIIARTLPFTPTMAERPDPEALLAAMRGDKKRSGSALRFILPRREGGVGPREADQAAALDAIGRALDRVASHRADYHQQS